ncbi:hypothetical protein CcI49_08075 [Frankia sp. CcI49]|uniref:hypothetical protein n=1 Tax=unclassified Frankia TaxID=2632575 RepID=UPI0006C9F6C2|nr:MULTISPECIES: hypothetical protein [unclassified Frankia]KPM54870.1 hypothetical protein ACG83_15800 [Frankia sp. R43]ONH61068.1 hypothetical protein CcI49_08075 [Frankia sp. CcI49]
MSATAITSTKAPAKPRQKRLSRQLLLTAHVLVSVGWNGVALGQLALAVTASVNGDIRHPAYELMHVFDRALNIPLALLTLATGILISLRTRWGLLHHWWVVTKLAITVFAVIFAAGFMRTLIVRAGDATADGEIHYSAPAVAIITGACLMNALFITATFLSTLKPWGRTRRGRQAGPRQRGPVPVSPAEPPARPAGETAPEPAGAPLPSPAATSPGGAHL